MSKRSQVSPEGSLSLFSPGALLVPVAYGAGLVALAIFVTGYLGESWSNTLSFMISDGWCNPARGQGIGAHCFGDFGLAYGAAPDPYVAGAPSASNSPLTMLIFLALSLLPYDVALFAYELAILAGSIGVIWWGSRRCDQLSRAVAVALIGVGSLGILIALDRGNHVGLLVPLTLWYVVALKDERWNRAFVAVVLIGSLKFWGVLLVVGLIAKRQYARAVGAIAVIAALGILPLTFFPGGIATALTNMIETAGDRNYAAQVSPFSVSIISFFRRLSCLAQDQAGCNFAALDLASPQQTALTLLVTALIVLAAFFCLRYSDLKVIAYVPLVAIGIIAVPEGPAYQCVFAVLAAAIFIRYVIDDRASISELKCRSLRLVRLTYLALVVALVFSIVPLPLWQFDSASMLTTSFGDSSSFRLANWTVPLTWSVFLVLATLLTIRIEVHRRGSSSPTS